jgi:hypothetical protein
MSRQSGRVAWLGTVVALAVATAMVAACGGAGGPSGLLVGKVTLGPITPVQQAGGPPNTRPYAATMTVETPAGAAVTTVTSGRDGTFPVRLAAGSYRLVPRSPAGRSLPHAARLDVVVVAGQTTTVTIAFDSGIR